jgi:hypothetical protein
LLQALRPFPDHLRGVKTSRSPAVASMEPG